MNCIYTEDMDNKNRNLNIQNRYIYFCVFAPFPFYNMKKFVTNLRGIQMYSKSVVVGLKGWRVLFGSANPKPSLQLRSSSA